MLCPWDSPGKNTGVGCHFLLQGIFPTQELNLGLLQADPLVTELGGKPKEGEELNIYSAVKEDHRRTNLKKIHLSSSWGKMRAL